jgi:predicted metal-dependent peptidase
LRQDNTLLAEKYDYSDFLRKFSAVNETVKVSDDEFDYIYYNYGLQHYHRMPLIEPLEYREDSRIRDFVIAIDTSGSVAGEEVQTFLRKTYNILKSRESFHNRINVHIIQCDAQIQSDEVITSSDDFDRYLETMEIRGLGGTDFRPVFDYVDRLLKEGEFSDLKGLIYFTDGLGIYPSSKPAYKTAFVFVESGYNVPEVPVWAMKLVLRPDEL